MTGRVIRIHAQTGSDVEEGDPICDIEALKMEIPILSPAKGTIKSINVTAGQAVEGGDPLAVIES